jgi:hypothetical protein
MTERASAGRSRPRSLQEIESDIARTRGRINRTLDVLGERLKPKNLARQAIERAVDRTRPLVRKAAETSAIVRAVLPAVSSHATRPTRGAATKAKGGSPGGPRKKERRAKKVGAALADAAAAAMIAAVCAPAPEPMKKRVRSTSRIAGAELDKVQAGASTSRRASRSGAGSARRSRSSAKSRRAR